MSDEINSESELLEQRRAAGIIHALRNHDSTTCSDCGESIQLEDATETMEVVAELEAHRQECQGEWFDD